MFLRAVAESLKPEKGNIELMIVKRKDEKIDFNSLTMEQRNAFETFSRLYALKSKETNDFIAWTDSHRKMFDDIIEKHSNGCKLAEGLTCMQTSMQKLCENLVLYDRLCYMEETALNLNLNIKVRYEKIMDEELSPRCYVLIAEKL
ncbi:hypothetical protein DOY81_009364 [Sarcophaga bullata]|nr:hypothetical protein DOY81_009364 [Sarcophaga bullata]